MLEKVTENKVQSLKSGVESETQTLGKTVEHEATQVLERMDGKNNDSVQAPAVASKEKIEFLEDGLKDTNEEIGSLKAELKKAQEENKKLLENVSTNILAQLAGLSAQMTFIQQGNSRSSDRSSRRSNSKSSSRRSNSSNSHRSLHGNNAQVLSPDLNNAPPIESTLSLYSQNFYHMPELSFSRVSTWANQQAMEELEQEIAIWKQSLPR